MSDKLEVQQDTEPREPETGQTAEEISAEEARPRGTEEITLIPVRFRSDRPSVHCDAGGLKVDEGEWVVVPCEQCNEVGQVSGSPLRIRIPEGCDIPRIERLATTREIELYYQNLEAEKNARAVCQERIEALGLEMKLVRVESLFDGSKIIFYYSADGRVDFRELVKDLVRTLRTRVEMCQIGIRHEAKMTGGIGSCGRVLCCTSFLKSFDPVSIKMAKVQNLPLNPNKISGFCGRLLCCLTFEYETYKEYAKNLPSMGNICDSPSGEGKVVRRNILKKTVSIATDEHGIVEFSNKELEDFKLQKHEVKGAELADEKIKGPEDTPEGSEFLEEGSDKKEKKTGSRQAQKQAKPSREKDGEKQGRKKQPPKKRKGRKTAGPSKKKRRNRKKGKGKRGTEPKA